MRREWHGAHSSTSSRFVIPEVFITRPALSRRARPIGGTSAHATCREPGPWHASQLTSISDHVVLYVSVFGSKPFTRFVEWHSAHMPFQFWALRVQCSQSERGIRLPG